MLNNDCIDFDGISMFNNDRIEFDAISYVQQ